MCVCVCMWGVACVCVCEWVCGVCVRVFQKTNFFLPTFIYKLPKGLKHKSGQDCNDAHLQRFHLLFSLPVQNFGQIFCFLHQEIPNNYEIQCDGFIVRAKTCFTAVDKLSLTDLIEWNS